jgi:PadR family transcriptional regulator, regulatory protein PadR
MINETRGGMSEIMTENIENKFNVSELENMSELENIYESGDEEYKKFIERIVKANREIFVLNVLADKPMCGYDVIKEIFMRCNVFLSQGNVYPILYSLEEEGIIRAEFTRGNMRSKLYFITEESRETVQKRIEAFIKAMESVLFFVNGDVMFQGHYNRL